MIEDNAGNLLKLESLKHFPIRALSAVVLETKKKSIDSGLFSPYVLIHHKN